MIAPKATGSAALVQIAALRKALGDPQGGILDRLIMAGKIGAADAQGRIDLVQAVPLFFGELRAEMRASTATAASERACLARAASAELRLAEARRDLVPTEDAAAAVDHLGGSISTALGGLPARVTRDIPTRRKVEQAVHQMQAQLARDLETHPA
jgi:hypothetical protein